MIGAYSIKISLGPVCQLIFGPMDFVKGNYLKVRIYGLTALLYDSNTAINYSKIVKFSAYN